MTTCPRRARDAGQPAASLTGVRLDGAVRAEEEAALKPARRPRSPGALLRAECEARDWSVDELARRAGLSAPEIEAVVHADAPLTNTQARGLARAFGTGWNFWRAAERNYREWEELE